MVFRHALGEQGAARRLQEGEIETDDDEWSNLAAVLVR
jgi:hypothetical protein